MKLSPEFASSEKSGEVFQHSVFVHRNDGILEISCADNFEYDVPEIKQNLEYIRVAASNSKIRVLSVSNQFTTVTKDVRHYVASGPHRDYVIAEAFVIHTTGQILLANLFLKINKPIVPAKFFRNKSDAEVWLKSFI